MMFRKFTAVLAVSVIACMFSAQSAAFVVWAVNGGADSSANSPGNLLNIGPGTNTIDLYFDTEGDISWGWDITLSSTSGLIYNVNGGDINSGLGAPTIDGYHQLGGDVSVDLSGGSLLLFSFAYDSNASDVLSLLGSSSYTSGTVFDSVSIAAADLVTTSAVPLPGAGVLMLSGLGVLGVFKRKR